jgi:hypothetical protein
MAIHKSVILCHQTGQPFDILLIDELVELQRDQFWVSPIHGDSFSFALLSSSTYPTGGPTIE